MKNQPKVKAGDVLKGVVADMGIHGEGIVKLDGYPVFIPFAIAGESVAFRIVYAKRDYAIGDVIEVLTPSLDRVKPKCAHFGRCGGCDLQHMSRPLQSECKRLSLERTLARIAGLATEIPPVVSLNEWHYRNKLSLPFGVGRDGKAVLGFYEKRSHSVVPLKSCPLHGDWADGLIAAVTEWANAFGISVYDERTGNGLLRHVVARMLDTLSVVLVINGDRLPRADKLAEALERRFGEVACYVSVNKKNTNVIFGDSPRLIFGKERPQNFRGFSAVVSPVSFLQVNNAVRDALYGDAVQLLSDVGEDIVELYSGVGLLTAELASALPEAKITAVEILPEAVKDADALMSSLGFSGRVRNVCADAAEFMKDFKGGRGALILDPPRKGCDPAVLSAAAAAGFRKIIYISCNPATLARDLKLLCQSGYAPDSARPYDMFPQTDNVETLAALSKKQ